MKRAIIILAAAVTAAAGCIAAFRIMLPKLAAFHKEME